MTSASCGTRVNSTVDTNVLLRLILNDEPEKFAAVVEFLHLPEAIRGAVELQTTTVSEIVYVLQSPHRGFSRNEIVGTLDAVVALPLRIAEGDIVKSAIELYRDVHADWDDCVVAAYALKRNSGRLLSYDKQLSRIPGLTRIEPPVAAS